MRPKDADGMANNVDPDQPASLSDLGLHCYLSVQKLRITTVFVWVTTFESPVWLGYGQVSRFLTKPTK